MPIPDERPALGAFGPTVVNDTPVIDPSRQLDAEVFNSLRTNVAGLAGAAALGWALVEADGTVTAAGGRLAGATASSPGSGLMDIVPAAGPAAVYVAALATAQDSTSSWQATAAVAIGGAVRVRLRNEAGSLALTRFLVVVF